MFRVLFVLFIIVPIIEIAVFMQIGALIGTWPTIAIVIITAWLGAKNVRQQGIDTMQNLQTKMAHGEAPSDEIVVGILLLMAGVLLITPGFVTDFFGLLLLVPQFRNALIQAIQVQLLARQSDNIPFSYHQSSSFDDVPNDLKSSQRQPQRNTIEGEFERKE